MPSELSPAWWTPRMTKAQMRKYLADIRAAQAKAKKKLAEEEWKEQAEKHTEVKKLEEKLDDVF